MLLPLAAYAVALLARTTRVGPGSLEYRQELAQALKPLCYKNTPPGGK